MKYLILLLLTLPAFAQNDSIAAQNISVISAEKLNVVYRGIDNPIKIAVPGAVSFTATAPGLRPDEKKGMGNYILNPGSGTEVFITIVAIMPDGKSKAERKGFRIMGLPRPEGIIEGYPISFEPIKMTKKEFSQAKIGVSFENFLFEVKENVWEFKLNLSKRKNIVLNGNAISEDAMILINKLKKGSVIYISDIKYADPAVCFPTRLSNIYIKLVD